jgi:hypothetical protein
MRTMQQQHASRACRVVSGKRMRHIVKARSQQGPVEHAVAAAGSLGKIALAGVAAAVLVSPWHLRIRSSLICARRCEPPAGVPPRRPP